MNTATKIVTSRAPVKEVIKDASMMKQKEMMAAHYDRLTSAPETGAKVAATFVPGNLNELLMCFDLVNNLPEVNAIQNGLRRTSGSFVLEESGHFAMDQGSGRSTWRVLPGSATGELQGLCGEGGYRWNRQQDGDTTHFTLEYTFE